MTDELRIMIVDDQVLFREALNTLLSVHSEFRVVAEAGNGQEAVDLIKDHPADIILMDLRMPVMDGVEATRKIAELYPGSRVIILTTFDDNDDVINALRAGAVGYLMKDVTSEKLFEAINSAYRGEYFLLPSITAKVVNELNRIQEPNTKGSNQAHPDLVEPLSPRELEILGLVAKGLNNREIAGQLVITEGTVKTTCPIFLGSLALGIGCKRC